MTTATATPQRAAVFLPVEQIQASRTNPRKHFDEAQLTELIESVRQHGVMQPILVRPRPEFANVEGSATVERQLPFELVAGERRFRAARAAGLAEIPAVVKELSDRDALEYQVIENLQRADLHPMEEAEGYEQLRKTHLESVDELAAKVGKSKAYVYGRMKLLALPKKARQLFYEGRLTASTALLVARIPDTAMAEKAAAEISGGGRGDDPMPYGQAKAYVERDFMLRLSEAIFNRGDAELVKKAGPCTTCPKRTGNQPELFGDVKSADVCTDPKCFRSKVDAHWEAEKKLAQASGRKVLSATEAKQLFPDRWSSVPRGSSYKSIDASAGEIGKYGKTWRQLLRRNLPETILARNPHDGTIHELVTPAALAAALKKAGVEKQSPSASSESWKAREKTEKAKRQLEAKIRALKVDAVMKAFESTKMEAPEGVLRAMVNQELRHNFDDVFKAHGWTVKKKTWQLTPAQVNAFTKSLNSDELIMLLLEAELRAGHCADEVMNAAVEAFGVDAKALDAMARAEFKEAQAAKRKKAQKSKKLAGKQPPKGETADPEERDDRQPGTCMECGCTDDTPCDDDGRPCSWTDKTHTLCSACA